MPPFIPSMSFSSTCTCCRMPSLAKIEAGACIIHHCLAYVLQEASNVGGTSLFFCCCCSKMLIAVSQVSYIILLLHKIASFSQIYEKVGAPHGSGVLLLAACEPLIMPDIVVLREELCITAPHPGSQPRRGMGSQGWRGAHRLKVTRVLKLTTRQGTYPIPYISSNSL